MNKHSAVVKLWIASLAVVTMAACSGDGEMGQGSQPVQPPNPAIGAPFVNSFTVKNPKTKQEGKAVDANEGDSVVLTWNVTGAKTITITQATKKDLKLDGVKGNSGSVTVEGLRADETFKLVAENANGDQASAEVKVKFKKKAATIDHFTATPQEISAGENTKLCWLITDASTKAKVEVEKAGFGVIYPANTLGAPETPGTEPTTVTVQKLLLVSTPAAPTTTPPADPYGQKKEETQKAEPKEVCIDDDPAETATYTLKVADGGEPVTKVLEVKVKETPVTFDIAFVAQPSQLAGADEVTLTWRVLPDDAKVSIDHGVVKDGEAKGEIKVKVSETTTFTLTATKGKQSLSRMVTVTVGGRVGGKVTARLLTPSVFAGESVKIAVSAENPAAKLNVYSPRGDTAKFTADGATLTITDAVSGNYVVEADGVLSNPVAVEVRQLETKDTTAWNGLGQRGLGFSIVGNASKTAQVTLTSFVGEAKNSSVPFDFGKGFAEKTKMHADYMTRFAPYVVNAVTFSPKGRAFAGMTGGILYSDNRGASWNILDILPAYDTSYKYKDNEESHPGCFGTTRKGTKSFSASIWLVNVLEVCDLAYDNGADGKDRLLMATDFGVFYIDGVEGHITDPANKAHALQGTLKKDSALFGKVVNRIVITKVGDQKVVVAAASDGVYINTKRGDANAWQQIDKAGLKDPVNAIAVSGTTIYAGTDKGLFASSGLDAASTFLSQGVSKDAVAIKALAVDDASTLYVGTDKGLKIGRACGESFVDVAPSIGSVRNIATASEGGRSAVVLTSDKGLFSSVGVAGTTDGCGVLAKTPAKQPDAPKDPQRPTTTGPGTTTPTPNRPS